MGTLCLLAGIFDVVLVGGIVDMIVGKVLGAKVLGRLLGIAAGIGYAFLVIFVLRGENNVPVNVSFIVVFAPAALFLLMCIFIPKNHNNPK